MKPLISILVPAFNAGESMEQEKLIITKDDLILVSAATGFIGSKVLENLPCGADFETFAALPARRARRTV